MDGKFIFFSVLKGSIIIGYLEIAIAASIQ